MADEVWTIRRMREWCEGYLERHGDEHPATSADWLICDACGFENRTDVFAQMDRPMNDAELTRMRAAVQARGEGVPLQYVSGETAFRHIIVRCGRGVLIPRPETELLVDHVLAALDAGGRAERARVLEIGCGTGCISLSVASERPGVHVVATDISPEAIELATRNRAALRLERSVDLVQCDLASGIDPQLAGTFDVLVSNPPYIPTTVLDEEVPAEVRDHEPRLALDGGADGLDVFRRILLEAPRLLAPGGSLICELYEGHLDAAVELVRAQGGWACVQVLEDYTHRPRFLVATREGTLPAGELWGGNVLRCDQNEPSPSVVDAASRVFERQGVVVLPTDSVYGIASAVTPHNAGHERIFEMKKRERTQTLPWLISSIEDLQRFAHPDFLPSYALELAQRYWPGALTLVVVAGERVPLEYQQADGTIALRLPASTLVQELARAAGGALACTSANTHGAPSPASFAELEPEIIAAADLTLDAGACPVGVASTIVSCTESTPKILRQGAVEI